MEKPKTIIVVWEAPRCRGTSFSYALFNGLRASEESAVFLDEPLHWRRRPEIGKLSSAARLGMLSTQIQSTRSNYPNAYIVAKNQAKQILYDGCSIDLRSVAAFNNLILIRDINAMLVSHECALKRMTDIPTQVTVESSGVPALYSLHRELATQSISHAVVDTDKLLSNPTAFMKVVLNWLELEYSDNFVRWDSVDVPDPPWGKWWYEGLRSSIGLGLTDRPKIKHQHPLAKQLRPMAEEILNSSII